MFFHQTLLPSLLLLLLHFLSSNAYIFIYAGCSPDKYPPNSPFNPNLNSFLSSSLSSSSQSIFNSFTIGANSTSPQLSAVFGLYQCRADLRLSDCASCVQSAVSQIVLVCPYSYGASLQLEGCYVRYGHTDFLNRPDTTIMFKKCSKSVDSDSDFSGRRDSVLADLQTAVGFKVSRSGVVQGLAQCMGDLSQPDCSTCLAQAVVSLKSLCGDAAAAHVFLGKCYAQYWASGYYDLNSISDGGATKEDDIGKIVAIIVGVILGLAIFIVILSLCRRSVYHY